MLKLYYLVFVLCMIYQSASSMVITDPHAHLHLNSTQFIGRHVNSTVYIGEIMKFDCTKKRHLSFDDVSNAINALQAYYDRGQWGQKCYANGWCVDSRNLNQWDSPKDCINESREKLSDCLKQGAGDGYIEQGAGVSAICMMHYWCDGC